MTIQTINPSTGKVINQYEEMTQAEVEQIIHQCQQAFCDWRAQSLSQRGAKMHKLANLLQDRKQEYAKLIAQEMGKPISLGQAEIEKCAWACEYYAQHAEDFLKPRVTKTNMAKSYVTYAPLGIIFAIMPWNFPFWQVFRFAAPTIMAGNAALLKHAPISTGSAFAIEKLFADAGLPTNLFRVVVLDNKGAEKVINHPQIAGVTLTGSVNAGKIVGSEAAKALKKCVLELGGNDPYVILEDADLDKAAEAVINSRMNNVGQVCIAAKRIIIVEPIQQKFKQLILDKIKRYQMGDPLNADTNLGPLARQDIRDNVHNQVQESIKKGAVLLLGGIIPEREGFYYPPTVLDNVHKGMPAYDEEIFGPVISFITAKDEKEAIHIANDSNYGLAGAVFTQDINKGEKIAAEMIQVGTCAVNTWVASDPRLPFGGIKNSGHGRELAEEGIHSFMNIKTINIA